MKYRNKKTVYAGITFDSKREAHRYAELLLLERTGRITNLQRQASYELAPSVKFADSVRRKPALRYIVDFEYVENGVKVCEDVKGMRTTAFEIKRHLMLSVHGIDVRITK